MSTQKLLSAGDTDPKLSKGNELPYLSMILRLAPGNQSGYEVCPNRSVLCTAGCLNFAGHGQFSSTQVARNTRTQFFFEDRPAFMAQLVREITNLVARAKKQNRTPAIRLNGTSDIGWGRIGAIRDGITYRNVFDAFPEVQFYDYTKVDLRIGGEIAPNYYLTYSLAEDNDTSAVRALNEGMNVAVVMNVKKGVPLPLTWGGYDVIDGDKHDYRFLDKRGGYVVGLRPKGPRITRQDVGGFVRDPKAGFDLTRQRVLAISMERKAA